MIAQVLESLVTNRLNALQKEKEPINHSLIERTGEVYY